MNKYRVVVVTPKTVLENVSFQFDAETVPGSDIRHHHAAYDIEAPNLLQALDAAGELKHNGGGMVTHLLQYREDGTLGGNILRFALDAVNSETGTIGGEFDTRLVPAIYNTGLIYSIIYPTGSVATICRQLTHSTYVTIRPVPSRFSGKTMFEVARLEVTKSGEVTTVLSTSHDVRAAVAEWATLTD